MRSRPGSRPSPELVEPRGEERPSLLHGLVVTVIGSGLPPLAAFATAPILAHTLGVEGRGDLTAATAPLLLMTAIATFGLPEALTFFVARSPAALRQATRLGLTGLAATGVVAVLLTIACADLISDGDDDVYALILSTSLAIIPTVCLAGMRGLAAGLRRWTLVATERGITAGLRLGSTVLLAVIGELTVTTGALVIALTPVAGGLAYLPLRRELQRIPTEPADPRAGGVQSGDLASFGGRMWLGSVAGILLSRIDQLLMAPISTSHQLGLYAVAVTVGEMPLVVTGAVREVSFASDASDNETERLLATARTSTAAATALGLVVALSLPWTVPLLFGSDFRDAVTPAFLVVAAALLGMPGSVAGSGLSARGRPGLRSASLLVACVVNIVLVLVLVPAHGAVGAAIATLAGYAVSGQLNIAAFSILADTPWHAFYGLRRSDRARIRSAVGPLVEAAGRRRAEGR